MKGLIKSILGLRAEPEKPQVPDGYVEIHIEQEDLAKLYFYARDIIRITASDPHEDYIQHLVYRMLQGAIVHNTPYTAIGEDQWNRARAFEDRITPLFEKMGVDEYPHTEFLVRDYVFHDGPSHETDARIDQLLEWHEDVESIIDDTTTALVRTAKKSKDPKTRSIDPKMARDGIVDAMRQEVWRTGPQTALERCIIFSDIYLSQRMAYGEHLQARFKRKARKEKKARPAISPRRKREIVGIFTKTSPVASNANQQDILKATLARMLSAAQEDINTLKDALPVLEDAVHDLEITNARERENLGLLREIESEIRQDFKQHLTARITLTAAIHAYDPEFCDERADELNALATCKENEAPLNGESGHQQARKPVEPQDSGDVPPDLQMALQHPGYKAQAQEILALRREAANLDQRMEDLKMRERALSVTARYLARAVDKSERVSAQMEQAIADMQTDNVQMEYLLASLKSGPLSNGHAKDGMNGHANGHQYPPLSQLGAWAKANLGGRVIITNNALKTAESSQYKWPEEIYQALELLADEYWQQKTSSDLGTEETACLRQKFNDRMHAQRLSIGAPLGQKSLKYASAYTVTHNGETLPLTNHLVRGVSRDPNRSMRIYFTWSQRRQAVIVGHLPTHLPNRFN